MKLACLKALRMVETRTNTSNEKLHSMAETMSCVDKGPCANGPMDIPTRYPGTMAGAYNITTASLRSSKSSTKSARLGQLALLGTCLLLSPHSRRLQCDAGLQMPSFKL